MRFQADCRAKGQTTGGIQAETEGFWTEILALSLYWHVLFDRRYFQKSTGQESQVFGINCFFMVHDAAFGFFLRGV